MSDRNEIVGAAIARSQRRLREFPSKVEDVLLPERTLSIEVNGEFAGHVWCIGDSPRETAVGWAFLHRFIVHADSLTSVHLTPDHVSIMCSGGVDVHKRREELASLSAHLPPAGISPLLPPMQACQGEDILEIARDVARLAREHGADLGTVHAALIDADGSLMVLCRDYDAGIAFASAVGWLIDQHRSASIAVVRATVTQAIVESCIRLTIGVIVTTMMPTSDAWRLARRGGVTIVGMSESNVPGVMPNAGHITFEDRAHERIN